MFFPCYLSTFISSSLVTGVDLACLLPSLFLFLVSLGALLCSLALAVLTTYATTTVPNSLHHTCWCLCLVCLMLVETPSTGLHFMGDLCKYSCVTKVIVLVSVVVVALVISSSTSLSVECTLLKAHSLLAALYLLYTNDCLGCYVVFVSLH